MPLGKLHFEPLNHSTLVASPQLLIHCWRQRQIHFRCLLFLKPLMHPHHLEVHRLRNLHPVLLFCQCSRRLLLLSRLACFDLSLLLRLGCLSLSPPFPPELSRHRPLVVVHRSFRKLFLLHLHLWLRFQAFGRLAALERGCRICLCQHHPRCLATKQRDRQGVTYFNIMPLCILTIHKLTSQDFFTTKNRANNKPLCIYE